jgi:hypothetical protein
LNDTLFDTLSKLPIESNEVTDGMIRAIEDRFRSQCIIFGASIPPDTDIFKYFQTKDQALYGSFKGEEMCATFLNEILWPLDLNAVTSDVIDDVVSAFDFSILTEYEEPDITMFRLFDPRDPLCYGNPREVTDKRTLFLKKIPFPLIANIVSDEQISEMISQSIFDVELFVAQVRNPLEAFELDDTHIYTRDVTVLQVLDDILDEFDSQIPIIGNDLASQLIPEIVAQLDVCPNPLKVSANGLHVIHPIHRRIDFHFPSLIESIFSNSTKDIAITSNSSSIETLDEIVLCLDPPEDPLDFYEFPLRDVEPLEIFEAPPDSEEDLAALANYLTYLILRTDVVPFVPILTELEDTEIMEVLNGITEDTTISKNSIESLVSSLKVDGINGISGPVRDVPHLVRPEDVVTDLLWCFLFQDLPVRPAEFDELIAEAVDDLDIEPEELSAEEPSPEEVAELLKLYGSQSPD